MTKWNGMVESLDKENKIEVHKYRGKLKQKYNLCHIFYII